MINAIKHTKNYFLAPEDYFWQWTEKGEVIEWKNASTICYRDDLISVLKTFSGTGLPPLGTVLLVLTACSTEINIHHKFFLLKTLHRFEDKSLYTLLDKAINFMRLINALPPELRTGGNRGSLITEIFEGSNFVFSNVQMQAALDELNSGMLDSLIDGKRSAVTKEQFVADLEYLSRAFEKFPKPENLELKLKTGLHELPKPATVFLPEVPMPGLTEQLLEDPQTRGMAKLAGKLISVLNIPLHARGSGDHSYGGISDITNRGNYDRLLLSELAQDDLLLMARLVNNEALYFRREEPPDNPKKTRTILMDTTLKMWGVPRVFSVSAALAFAHHSKHGELIAAYTLGGEKYEEADIGSKPGITQLLGRMQHALHCGPALQAILKDRPATDENEYIFITAADLLNSAAFQASLQKVAEALSFVITVNRNGEFHFFECIKGRTRLLSAAKIDLEAFLFETLAVPVHVKNQYEKGPAFFSQTPAPLLFPKIRIKAVPAKMSIHEKLGALAVNETQRVLFLAGKEKGAYEILGNIERGSYTFGWDDGKAYLLVNNSQIKLLKLYTVALDTLIVNECTLPAEIENIKDSVFNRSHLYMQSYHASFDFDCNTYQLLSKKNSDGFSDELKAGKAIAAEMWKSDTLFSYLSSSIGPWSAMYKIKDLYVCTEGKLVMGNYHLDLLWNNQNIRIQENVGKRTGHVYSKEINNRVKFLPNKKIKFSIRVWEDGSEAVIDSRGFLHLKSSDKKIPEITIVLISGGDTACWAADGRVCGCDYFTNGSSSAVISNEDFFAKYIQPFIDRLIQYENTTKV